MTPVRAWLSSYWGHDGADKCIDGVTKGTMKDTCNSKSERAPWLALDYGKKARVSVEKVVLFSRPDDPLWAQSWAAIENIQIRLSNELPTTGKAMFWGGKALGSFKGPATLGEQVEIYSGPGWEKKAGRYLIIQMNFGSSQPLALMEAYAVGQNKI